MNMYGFHFDTTYTALPQQFFAEVNPELVTSPKIVIINHDLADSMGLDFSNSDRLFAERIKVAFYHAREFFPYFYDLMNTHRELVKIKSQKQ